MYAAQDYEPRQLVIVSDGREEFTALRDHAERVCRSGVAATWVERGSLSLGALRNLSIELAAGDIVAQWDDDDLSHPRRLSVQYDCMQREGALACVLADHLHWVAGTRSLYWCDWTRPRGVASRTSGLPCTIMCHTAAAPRYPDSGPLSRRSEDAVFARALLERGAVASSSGSGWAYVYVVHGANTWDEPHYRRIVAATAMTADDLECRRNELAAAVETYALGADVTVRDHLDLPVLSLSQQGAHEPATSRFV